MKTKTLLTALTSLAFIGAAQANTAGSTGYHTDSMSAPHASSANSAAADKLGASMVTEVKFEEGQSVLSKAQLADVTHTINSAKGAGEIDEIKIISWADREYPAKGAKAPKDSVKLAEKRAENLENYIEDSLKVSSVDTFNMAERPNAVQRFLNTPTARVKRSLESNGAAPTGQEGDTGLFGLSGKASTALVLVYLK